MRHYLFVVTMVVLGCGAALMLSPHRGQAQNTGPYTAYMSPQKGQPKPPADFPFQLGNGPPRSEGAFPFQLNNTTPAEREPAVEPNQDIAVKHEVGEWMIYICDYSGPQAHTWARQMVAELRGAGYRLPAYTYNKGSDERQQERERLEKIKAAHRKLMRETGQSQPLKIYHRRFLHVEDHVAVLIGGYRDMDTARKALDEIRKLKAPDPKRVKLDTIYIMPTDTKGEEAKGHSTPVNPFLRSFVVRNPTLPPQQPDYTLDVDVLRRLNADEPYSLLKAPKKVTLVIRQFIMPTLIQQDKDRRSPINTLGLSSPTNKEDTAAKSARNLAEFLRTRANLEAYVLHSRVSSVVTVGSFDSVHDPHYSVMRERLRRMLGDPRYDALQLYPDAYPMIVPGREDEK